MSTPILSIVIPVFNSERSVCLTLKSVLENGSEPKKVEVIVVDDGSVDRTAEALAKFRAEHALAFSVITTEHRGIGAARNIGTKKAAGEFVLFLDGDDLINQDSLSSFLHFIEQNPADIITYGIVCYKADGTFVKKTPQPQVFTGQGDSILANWMESGYYTALRDKAVRRTYLLRHNLFFPENIIYEDVLWTISLYAYSPKVEYCGIYLYKNIINENSVTARSCSAININSLKYTFERLDDTCQSNNIYLSDMYKKCVRIIMCGVYWQIVPFLRIDMQDFGEQEQQELLCFLEKNKSIMRYSKKFNRRYIYFFIGKVFGIKALSWFKR